MSEDAGIAFPAYDYYDYLSSANKIKKQLPISKVVFLSLANSNILTMCIQIAVARRLGYNPSTIVRYAKIEPLSLFFFSILCGNFIRQTGLHR